MSPEHPFERRIAQLNRPRFAQPIVFDRFAEVGAEACQPHDAGGKLTELSYIGGRMQAQHVPYGGFRADAGAEHADVGATQ